jgi:hypothetical protein
MAYVLGLALTIHVIKSQIHLVRQFLYINMGFKELLLWEEVIIFFQLS